MPIETIPISEIRNKKKQKKKDNKKFPYHLKGKYRCLEIKNLEE